MGAEGERDERRSGQGGEVERIAEGVSGAGTKKHHDRIDPRSDAQKGQAVSRLDRLMDDPKSKGCGERDRAGVAKPGEGGKVAIERQLEGFQNQASVRGTDLMADGAIDLVARDVGVGDQILEGRLTCLDPCSQKLFGVGFHERLHGGPGAVLIAEAKGVVLGVCPGRQMLDRSPFGCQRFIGDQPSAAARSYRQRRKSWLDRLACEAGVGRKMLQRRFNQAPGIFSANHQAAFPPPAFNPHRDLEGAVEQPQAGVGKIAGDAASRQGQFVMDPARGGWFQEFSADAGMKEAVDLVGKQSRPLDRSAATDDAGIGNSSAPMPQTPLPNAAHPLQSALGQPQPTVDFPEFLLDFP